MNLEELEQNESDDSSDEDFNPSGAAASGSEEESGGEDVSGGEEDKDDRRKRRKGGSQGPRKKMRNGKTKELEEEKEDEKENETLEVLTEEEKKQKSDTLWADFLKDCDPPARKSQSLKSDVVPESPETPNTKPRPEPKCMSEPKQTTVLTFAGEEVKVERAGSKRGGGGLGSLLSRIGKAGKLSTLEKSKLDWEGFKQKEGIKEDLATFNKGKSGYLERQDFLTRTDVRQFELEKQMRSQRRSLNR